MNELRRSRRSRGATAALLAVGMGLGLWAFPASAQPVILMSKGEPGASDTAGGILDRLSSLSADGRFVVFTSTSTQVVPGQNDTNGASDIFLYDRVGQARFLVSHVPGSQQQAANGLSYAPVISDNGNFVMFTSAATDLVAGMIDNNGPGADFTDVFLYERATGDVTLVSHQEGAPLSTGDDASGERGDHAISADGLFLAFTSVARDLVNGQADGNGVRDVFVYDRFADRNTLASHVPGTPERTGSAISERPVVAYGPDGTFVAYESLADDLVPSQVDDVGSSDVFLFHLQTGTNVLVSGIFGSATDAAGGAGGNSFRPALDSKGGFVFFVTQADFLVLGVTDVNGSREDIYAYDRGPGTLTLISHSASSLLETGDDFSDNGGLRPAVSDLGEKVAFVSQATNLIVGQVEGNGGTDVFLWDRGTGNISLASRTPSGPNFTGNGVSSTASISGDANVVAFASLATDLIPIGDANGGADVYEFDASTGSRILVSHTLGLPNQAATIPSGGFVPIDFDGQHVAYVSSAADLVALDTNGTGDVFLFTRSGGTGTSEVASLRAPAGFTGANHGSQTSNPPRNGISTDGNFVVFLSKATNLVVGQNDPNGSGQDVFLYDRVNDKVRLVSRDVTDPDLVNPQKTANAESKDPVVSGDGRYVAFASKATNLVPGQTDGNTDYDVFVWESATGNITLASHVLGATTTAGSAGSERPSLSKNGSLVAYESQAIDLVSAMPADDSNGASDVFLYDRGSGFNSLISPRFGSFVETANGASSEPVINATGLTFVAFTSLASNLLSGAPEPGGPDPDVFVHNRSGLSNAIVSQVCCATNVAGNGASNFPSISDAGDWVAFHSLATDLVTAQNDTNSQLDVFLFNRSINSMTLISHAATDTARSGNDVSQNPQVSGDSGAVVYESEATDLIAGQADAANTLDVFHFNRAFAPPSNNRLMSHADGLPTQAGNGVSSFPQVSFDGLSVAFVSEASNLAHSAIDTNGLADVFVWDSNFNVATVASRKRGTPSTTGNNSSLLPVLSANGRFVAFFSAASDLVAVDVNAFPDAFLFEAGFTDLDIIKTSNAPAVPGAFFDGYEIVVSNLSVESVAGATVTDLLPPTLMGATWTCTPSGGATCSPSGTGNINDTVSLPVGGSLFYDVMGTLALTPTTGTLYNEATVTPPVGFTDPYSPNDTGVNSIPLSPNAVLLLSHTDAPDPVATFGAVTYLTTITNNGPSIAVQVSLSVDVPPGATAVSVSNPGCVLGPTITCGNLGNLLPGQNIQVTAVIMATSTPGTMFSLASADSLTTSAPTNASADTLVVDAAQSLIEFFTVTSTSGVNTLEWRTPLSDYDHTRILVKAGSCPSDPLDPTATVLLPILPTFDFEPGAGAQGQFPDTAVSNFTTYCYAAYVDRDGAGTTFSPGRFAKGRPFDTAISPAKWAFSTGATSVTPPGIGEGGVYVPSNDRALYAVGRGSMGGKWLSGYTPLFFQQPVQSRPPVVPFTIGPATSVTYVSSQDGTVFAIDSDVGDGNPTDGLPSPIWPKNLGSPVQAAPAGWFDAFGADPNINWMLVGTRGGGGNVFRALDASTGNDVLPNGTFNVGGIGTISGGAAVDYNNKRVYFTSRDGGNGKTAYCLPFITTTGSEGFGAPCWAASGVGDIDYGPVLRNDVVFVASNTGDVRGLDAGSGFSNWTFGPVGLPKGIVVPDRTNDDVYVSAGTSVWGLTYLSPTARWQVTSIPNPSQPVFARIGLTAYVFVGSSSGFLYQIDAATGTDMRFVGLGAGGAQIGAPSFDTVNNMIYVGSDAGVVYAVQVPLP